MTKKKIKTIGILGGGQLAMFLCISAKKLNINVSVYSEKKDFSAKKFCNSFFIGSFNDKSAIEKFYRTVDVITVETENIPKKTLLDIEHTGKLKPLANSIIICQNRLKEKKFLNSLDGIKTTSFYEINKFSDLKKGFNRFGEQFLIKSCELGYDGKNQFKVNKKNIESFKQKNLKNFIGEKIVAFEKEVSVIVSKDIYNNISCFPPVHNIHENNVLRSTEYPAKINTKLEQEAIKQAMHISNKLKLIGILAIEMFVINKNEIIINELAPRPHNSGHWTIDCCDYNQFDNLILAITNRKIKSPKILFKGKMQNILGNEYRNFKQSKKNIVFYDYLKKEIKPNRKMAHFTLRRKL